MTGSKRIAFGAANLTSTGMDGLNRYTGEMLKELLDRDPGLIAYAPLPELSREYGVRLKLTDPSLNRYGFKGNINRLIWHQTGLRASLKQERVSVFYSPVPEGMLFPVCPQVITVHDILPLLFPDVYPRIKYYFRFIVPRLLRASSAVIAVSESTKKDIENHYDLSDRPVHVVYQGYRDDVFVPASPGRVKEIKAKYRLDSYILSVGETRPYKNIRRLIRAFAGVPIPGLKLALAGKINRLDRSLLELPGELGISGKVTFLDYVPDEELAALYSGAVAFIFPSLYEGFGIPPLEAMACGCPVIASKVASLPEVCGEAAVYVDPCDNDSIAGGIFKTANDKQLQDTLRQKGLERVKSFSYREAAEKLVKILYEYSG